MCILVYILYTYIHNIHIVYKPCIFPRITTKVMGLRFFSIANLAIAGGGKQEVELRDFLFMFMTVNQGDLRRNLPLDRITPC